MGASVRKQEAAVKSGFGCHPLTGVLLRLLCETQINIILVEGQTVTVRIPGTLNYNSVSDSKSVCAGPPVAEYGAAAVLEKSLRTFSRNMLLSVGSSGLVWILHDLRKASLNASAAARVC